MRTDSGITEQGSNASVASAACLILVHGTGAGAEGPPGEEKWWQRESNFVQGLLNRLADRDDGRFDPEAFKWSGDNSERARCNAGRALAERLLQLERSNVPYHLIGHSHGGSVIWHALNHVARERPKLDRLVSWITVGTPFLQFAPRNNWYLGLVCLALLAGLATLLLLSDIGPDLWNHGHFNTAASTAIGFGLAAIAGLALIAGLDVWTQIRLRLIAKGSRLSQPSLVKLSQNWLGIAHDLDEPINGLTTTLSVPPQIAPRTWRPSAENPAQREKGVMRILRRALNPYDSVIAPVIDAFVWDTGIARLQGRDIKGAIMTACRARPPFFSIAWPKLPDRVREALSRKADAAASLSARAFRAELQKIGAGDAPADRIARAISWNEVIHTTYFTNAQITELCASFIGKRSVHRSAARHITEATKWVEVGPIASPVFADRHFEPQRLYFARIAAFLALVGLLGFAISAAHRAWVLPYTNRFQIDLIASNVAKPQFTRLWESGTAGNVLIRLVALKQNDQVFTSLANIRNPNTRIMAAEQVAYAHGYLGDQAALDRVLADYAKDDHGQTDANPALVIRTYALAGAIAGKSPLKEGLAADIHSVLAGPDGVFAYGMMGPIELAASLILETGPLSDVDALVSRMAFECKRTLAWLKEHNYTPSDKAVQEEIKQCEAKQPKAALVTQTDEHLTPISNHGAIPAASDRYAEVDKVRLLVEKKDYSALVELILSWDDRFGKDVVEAYGSDWNAVCRDLNAKGLIQAAVRAEDLLEASYRERLEWQSTLANENFKNAQSFAEVMVELGRVQKLRDDATRLDAEATKGSIFDNQKAANAGILWLAVGDIAAWRKSFNQAIRKSGRQGEYGFPFAMNLAEIASDVDRQVTLEALGKAAELIEDAFAVDSVPNYGHSLTDISRFYAKLGEYRLARDVAEQVGQRLAENPGGLVRSDENDPGDSALEKDSLRGGGVLGGYIEILDAEISQSTPDGKMLMDLIGQMPAPTSIYLTVFNKG